MLRIIPLLPLLFPNVSVFYFVFRTGLSYTFIFLPAICQALSSFDVLYTFAPHLTIFLLSARLFHSLMLLPLSPFERYFTRTTIGNR